MNPLRLFGARGPKRDKASPTGASAGRWPRRQQQQQQQQPREEEDYEDLDDDLDRDERRDEEDRRKRKKRQQQQQQQQQEQERGKMRLGKADDYESDDGSDEESDLEEVSSSGRGTGESSDEDDDDLVDIDEDEEFFASATKDGQLTSAQLEAERKEIVRTNFEVLCAVPFFARFPEEHQRQLFEELRVEHYEDDDRIVTQGEMGDRMYIIVDGEAVVWRDDVGEITHLYTHDFFGEQALIFSQVRNSNVSAVGKTTVMYLSKDAFDKYENIRVFMVVQKIPLLARLRPDMQRKIVARLTPLPFEKGDFVVTQGEVGDAFYMIAKGSAEVVENGEVTTHLYEGHNFGQMALMSGAPRLASVRASEQLICFELKAKDFQALMEEDSEFSQLLQTDTKVIRRRRSKRGAARNKTRNPSVDSGNSRRLSFESGNRSLGHIMSSSKLIDETSVVNSSRKGGNRVINGFVLRREIGRGTFGRVRLCIHQKTGEEYAIKIIDKSKIKDNVSVHTPGLDEMRQEVAIMKRLRHPNIVNLVAVIDDPADDHLYIVTEYCENGALMDGLDNNEPLKENVARERFRDLLLGLHYLHAQGVIHRDIKPANLLLTKDNIVKIADFGAARMITGGTKWISGVTGTPAFMAPELLVEDHDEYDGPAVDLWSCGATLFMMVTGVPPWMSDDEIKLAKKVKNDELHFPSDWNQRNYSPHLKNLIQRLLSKDPLTRPNLEEVMDHEWVTEEGSEMLLPLARELLAEAEGAEGDDNSGRPSSFLASFDGGAGPSTSQEEREAAIDRLQSRGSSSFALHNFSPSSSMSAPRSDIMDPDETDIAPRGDVDLDALLKQDVDLMVDGDIDLNSDDESEYSQQTNKYDIGRMNDKRNDGDKSSSTAEAKGDANEEDEDGPPLGIPLFSAPLPDAIRGGKKVAWANVRYSSSKEQNNRARMEDCISICSKLSKSGGDSWFSSSSSKHEALFYAAVFDGHGGVLVSELLKESLHRTIANQPGFPENLDSAILTGCLEFDRAMLHKAASAIVAQRLKISNGEARQSLLRTKGDRADASSAVDEYRKTGSTALLAFVSHDKATAERLLTVAWIGDTRAVLCRDGKAVQLSDDHKASREDEKARIRAAGGTVNRKGQVDGSLAVSRAFGDIMHKGHEIERLADMTPTGPSPEDDELLSKGIVIAKPDIISEPIVATDRFLILATDGLWDTVSNEEAVKIVSHSLSEKNDIQVAADALVKHALVHSVDNISVVLVSFD